MLTSSGSPLLNWVYSIDSSKMISISPAVVLNFNQLFLKLNRFICNYLPVLTHSLIRGPHQKSQQRSQPKTPALRILWKHMAGIYVGWSCWSGWKKGRALQPAAINPSHVFPENKQGWQFCLVELLVFQVWPWYQTQNLFQLLISLSDLLQRPALLISQPPSRTSLRLHPQYQSPKLGLWLIVQLNSA